MLVCGVCLHWIRSFSLARPKAADSTNEPRLLHTNLQLNIFNLNSSAAQSSLHPSDPPVESALRSSQSCLRRLLQKVSLCARNAYLLPTFANAIMTTSLHYSLASYLELTVSPSSPLGSALIHLRRREELRLSDHLRPRCTPKDPQARSQAYRPHLHWHIRQQEDYLPS